MVTDGGQIVVREQWNHPYKEDSSGSLQSLVVEWNSGMCSTG